MTSDMKTIEFKKQYPRILLQQKSNAKTRLQDNRKNSIRQNKIIHRIYNFQSKSVQLSRTGKTQKALTIKRNKERDRKYASLFPLDFSFPSQLSKTDVYLGGAELEYRSHGNIILKIGNNVPLSDDDRKFIRKGIKGISLGLFIDKSDLKTKTQMQGRHWALTIETSINDEIDANGQMPVALELIIGGSHGATINDLITGSEDAANTIESLDLNQGGIFTIENFGRKVCENVSKKEKRQIKAQKAIDGTTFKKKSANQSKLNNLSAKVECNLNGKSIKDEKWGLQITMGIPLDEIHKVGHVLEKHLLTDTSSIPYSSDCILTGSDIVKQWIGNQYYRLIINQKWNREQNQPFDNMNPEHIAKMDEIEKSSIPQFISKLSLTYKKQIPSLNTLDGLAKVIAAYIRGVNNPPQQGPKHLMKFVNKNPLQAVIANAVDGKGEKMYTDLKNTCVDIIISNAGVNSVYTWDGISLSITEWGKKMKENNIDLVALYDARYRSAQIGNLSSLNDVESANTSFRKAPVIEYRDLGSITLSKMADIFRSLKEKIDA